MSVSATRQRFSGAAVAAARPASPGQSWWTALRHTIARQPAGAVAAGLLLLVAVMALAGSALPVPDADQQSLRDRLQPPMSQGRDGTLHLLGTDQLGRDVLARTIAGARLSLGIAASAVLVSGIAGSLIGLIAGYRRGWVEFVAMRLVDAQMAVPPLLLAIFLLYLLGSSIVNLVVLLSILNWWSYTRIVRAEAIRIRELPYIEAAVVAGGSEARIVFRHLLPQLIPVLIVLAVLDFASVMLAEAGISFLGFGVQPPNSSWGRMVSEGQAFVTTGAWWLFGAPGLAIFFTVLLTRTASGWLHAMFGAPGGSAR
jgi:peptide/nickel transport system permease protein